MNMQERNTKPCPARTEDFAEYHPLLENLFEKIKRSHCASTIQKNGDWLTYTPEQVFEAVAGEFDEYREAYVAQELRGRHGQIEELYDVAVTAIKGILRLREGNQENDCLDRRA